MIYANEQRANEVAEMLNERRGYPRAKAVLTADGWTVIASYKFGQSGPAATPAAAVEVA
jgi:hypothetical protein